MPENSFFKPAIQPKLKVNQPGDSYEQEADLIAEKVVNMPEQDISAPLPASPPEVQRQEEEEEEKEEEPVVNNPVSIQRMNDEEREEIAAKHTNEISPNRGGNKNIRLSGEEEDHIQAFSGGRPPQKYQFDVLQLSGRGPPPVGVQFQQTLQNSATGGEKMSPSVGNSMETRFGADFSSVRIHTDATAGDMSRQVNAHAFTYGNHIYFNSGKYDPGSVSGRTLLAHELTHTIQQGASPVIGNNLQRKHTFTALQRRSVLQRRANSPPYIGNRIPEIRAGENINQPVATRAAAYLSNSDDLYHYGSSAYSGTALNNRVPHNANLPGDGIMEGETELPLSYPHSRQDYITPAANKASEVSGYDNKPPAPKTLRELQKEKKDENREMDEPEEVPGPLQLKEEEEVNISAGNYSEEKEEIQRSEIGSFGGFASRGNFYEAEDSPPDVQTKALSSPAEHVRIRSLGEMIQGGWFDNAVNAVSGLASDISGYIEEGIDAAKEYLWERITDFLARIPGYTILSYILGHDPLTGREVVKTPLTLLGAVLDIIPVGGSIVRAVLDYFEATNPVANWLFTTVERFSGLVSGVETRFENFWNRLSPSDAANPQKVIQDVGDIFMSAINQLVSFVEEVGEDFLAMVKEIAIDHLARFIKSRFPDAYDLLKVILGEDPVTKEQVDRNGANILNAGLKVLGERGAQIKSQMVENGIFEQCAAWIDRSIDLVFSLIVDVGNIFDTLWDSISFETLRHPLTAFTEIAEAFLTPFRRITSFITDAVVQLLSFLREALLTRLSNYAKETRGYFLITVLIGRDPFTDEVVERNTENIIHGFFSLMEGGEEQFQQMKQSGKIDLMTQKVTRAVNRLNFTFEYIKGLFTSLWNSLDWIDFMDPPAVFRRIVNTFGAPVIRLVRFVVSIVQIAVEVLLVAMNFPVETVNNIIQRSLEVFGNIQRDPIGFLTNILRGIKQGFVQFFENILSHLMGGLATWLFGSLGEIGIERPPDLSFRSILNLVMQVLNITVERIMERVWLKLTEQIGEKKVAKLRRAIDRLTGIWTFIKDVVERGPVAIWELIEEKLSGLWNMVIDATRNWIMTRVIAGVTTRLLSMLDPTGIMAVINSIIAIYKAIQSFIEQLREMLEIFNSFVNGIAEVATGNIRVAADYLERAMARGIPVLIGFLANQVGLSGIGRRLAEIIEGIREKITEGIDWLVERALRIGRPVIDGVIRGIEFGERVVSGVRAAFGAIFSFRAGGEAHELWVEENNGSTEIKVASDPMGLQEKIAKWRKSAEGDPEKLQAISEVMAQYNITKQKADVLASQGEGEEQTLAQNELNSAMEVLKEKIVVVFNLMPDLGEELLTEKVGQKYVNTEGIENGNLNEEGLALRNELSTLGYTVIDKTENNRAYIRRREADSLPPLHFDDEGILKMGSRPGSGAETHSEYEISKIDFMNFEGDTTDKFEIKVKTQNGNEFVASILENDLEKTTGIRTETQRISGSNLARQSDTGIRGRSTMNTNTAGLDRAHLIANRFQGPGEAESLNIILTSANYNRIEMAKVERDIDTEVKEKTSSPEEGKALPAGGIYRFNMEVKAILEYNEGRSLSRAIKNRLIEEGVVAGDPADADHTRLMNQIFEKLLVEARTEQGTNELRRKTRSVKYTIDSSEEGRMDHERVQDAPSPKEVRSLSVSYDLGPDTDF